MEKMILIKYGELTTKKGNRNFFVKTLKNNLDTKLKRYNASITMDLARMYITYDETEEEQVIDAINTTFGIHSYHMIYTCESTKEKITDLLIETVKKVDFKTFKVKVKRSDKSFKETSEELAPYFGGIVLKNKDNIKVDVHNPEVLINIEILKEKTLIYYNAFKGLGGYPIGTQPKGLLMLSGGIDSPVAGYLAMKRGIKVEAVYFEAIPHTSLEAREKVLTLAKKLAKYQNEVKVHIVPFTKIQEEIYKNVKEDYVITIMRRMMYRIMEMLAKKNKAYAIINGESIGQVASQTLHSMHVINSVTNYPVIRPVACFDKLEIIDIAKKIDTYKTSILPYEDCCTVFVPKHPVINPSLDECIKQEEKIDYQELLIDTVKNTFTLKIKNEQEENLKEFL